MAPKKTIAKKAKAAPKAAAPTKGSTKAGKSIVTIEACKSWGAFKTRAAKIEAALKGVATVKINEEKPRKGTFEIKANGKTIISLVGLARPFPKLKALDMDAVAADVLKAC